MLACVDVAYEGSQATAAALFFEQWSDGTAQRERIRRYGGVKPYVPGRFFERELPCILGVLDDADEPLQAVIIDGYVWLEEGRRPGLGAHLFEALGHRTAVIGVAKNPFVGMRGAAALLRGVSQRPLYVTTAGIELERAVERVQAMHGRFRLPTLLKRVDRRCRDAHRGLPTP